MLVAANRVATLMENSVFFKINPSLSTQTVVSEYVELPLAISLGSLKASEPFVLTLQQTRCAQAVTAGTTLVFNEVLS